MCSTFIGVAAVFSHCVHIRQPSRQATSGPALIENMQTTRESKISKKTAALVNAAVKDWLNQLDVWFPSLDTQAYFFPPLHFNKVPYKQTTIAAQSVLVPQTLDNTPGKSVQEKSGLENELKCGDKCDQQSSHKSEQSVFGESDQTCAIDGAGNKSCTTKDRKPVENKTSGQRGEKPKVPQLAQALASTMWPLDPDISAKKLALPVMPSDVRDDVAHQRVLQYLRCLADDLQEVMFVISHLDFAKYLMKSNNKHRKAMACFPRAENLPASTSSPDARQGLSDRAKDNKEKRGDFDVLIIHPKYGLVIGEVKSVGGNPEHMKDNPDQAITKKVELAVKQLKKSEKMLGHLISDIETPVHITKTLMLPNLTSQQLLQALQANCSAAKALCECLGVQGVEAAVSQCLCRQHVHGKPSSDSSGPTEGDSQKTAEGVSEKQTEEDSEKIPEGDFEKITDSDSKKTAEKTADGDLEKTTEVDSVKTLEGDSVGTAEIVSEASENTTDSSCNKACDKAPDKVHENASENSSKNDSENTSECVSEVRVKERWWHDWSWWRHAVQSKSPQKRMTRELYKKLVARFGGPATTIEMPTVTPPRGELRSLSQAIAYTGLVMARLTLYPDQVDILFKDEPLVFLTGPPGTGKSIVLAVKGLLWLKRGVDVHLVVSHVDAQAVSLLMKQQLESCLTEGSPVRVCLHKYFLENDVEAEKGVDKLATIAKENPGGELHVIADEASNYGFDHFCKKLLDQVPGLHLWAATVQRVIRPRCLTEYVLTAPLRCPPVVEKEVSKSQEMGKSVVKYGNRPSPAPTDGPHVKWLKHKKQKEHKAGPPEKCERCGKEVAQILQTIIVPGESDLQYRDVLLICRNPTNDIGLVKGLRAGGIPLKVVAESDMDNATLRDDSTPHDATPTSRDEVIESLALAKDDKMIVTSYKVVQGLERRIVIGMGDQNFGNSGLDQLYSMSRCTSQLIWIGNL